MKRYYFTTINSEGESICNDHIGNIRGARTVAQKYSNQLNECVYINECETEDIIDVVYPHLENVSRGTFSNQGFHEKEENKMAYNLKEIMKRAWEIKKEDERNIFGLCLKSAWQEAKFNKVADVLIKKGFKVWKGGKNKRIYINGINDFDRLGLDNYTRSYGDYRKAEIYYDSINKWVLNNPARRAKNISRIIKDIEDEAFLGLVKDYNCKKYYLQYLGQSNDICGLIPSIEEAREKAEYYLKKDEIIVYIVDNDTNNIIETFENVKEA